MASPTNEWPVDGRTPSPNLVLKGDGDVIRDLLVHKSDMIMISCWELSEQELEMIVKTGKIYLGVYSYNHPVVGMAVDPLDLTVVPGEEA